jgi:hypothetical protein
MPLTAQTLIINVVTASVSKKTALRLFKSITSTLPNYQFEFSLLLFAEKDTDPEIKFPMEIFCFEKIPFPIGITRNICQDHLQKKMRSNKGIGMVLDDDLTWTQPQDKFTALLKSLLERSCDMAFMGLAGDAPIPNEYTRASPTLDLLFAISRQDCGEKTISVRNYIKQFNWKITSDPLQYSHHDYYSFSKNNFALTQVDLNDFDWEKFILNLYLGKTTTRNVFNHKAIQSSDGRERGGATIVFNPNILDIKNPVYRFGKWTSRRSDMLMAKEASHFGYQLFTTPVTLSHDRRDSIDGHSPDKILGDIIGYALVESRRDLRFDATAFSHAIINRIIKTKTIILHTNQQVELILDWLISSKAYLGNEIEKLLLIIEMNNNLISELVIAENFNFNSLLTRNENLQ